MNKDKLKLRLVFKLNMEDLKNCMEIREKIRKLEEEENTIYEKYMEE